MVKGFTEGFPLNYCGSLSGLSAQNHASARQNPDAVNEDLAAEIHKGRIAGPFDGKPFPEFFCSPLAVVAKKDGKFRRIHDLSFPKDGDSVNAGIPREYATVQYETLDCVISAVVRAGRGAMIAKADIEKAFRIIPISPSDYKYLGFLWASKYWYDKCLPMGASTSCQTFERFSCALQWIMINHFSAEGMSHILDDFIFIGPPHSQKCRADLLNFLLLAQELGIPIKASKTVWPASIVPVHGVEIDTNLMQVRLPPDKLRKISTSLNEFLSRKKVTLRQLQSLIGLLNFACTAIVPGRSFLRRLIALTMRVRKPNHWIRLTSEARADLKAWLMFIQSFNGRSMLLSDTWCTSDSIRLYSDASKKGFAVVLGSKWCYGTWPSVWLAHPDTHHINLMELYPIVLAFQLFGRSLANHRVLFTTDNMTVTHVVNKQSSRDRLVMILIRRLVVAALKFNVHFQAQWISGKTNVVADFLSRLQVSKARQVAPWLAPTPVAIPEALKPWDQVPHRTGV